MKGLPKTSISHTHAQAKELQDRLCSRAFIARVDLWGSCTKIGTMKGLERSCEAFKEVATTMWKFLCMLHVDCMNRRVWHSQAWVQRCGLQYTRLRLEERRASEASEGKLCAVSSACRAVERVMRGSSETLIDLLLHSSSRQGKSNREGFFEDDGTEKKRHMGEVAQAFRVFCSFQKVLFVHGLFDTMSSMDPSVHAFLSENVTPLDR